MTKSAEQEFDCYAANYEETINEYIACGTQKQDFFTESKARHLKKVLATVPNDGPLKVLDVGCGHGLIHPYLKEEGYKLHGVDVAERAIEIARTRNPEVAYDVYSGSLLPYADGSFDAAYTICVLHHVPPTQWDAFVRDVYRVLRPGGVFLIFEHNKLNPAVQWIVRRIPFDRNAVLLTSWRAKRLVREAGFVDIKSKHILFFPSSSPTLQSVEARLGWFPMGAQYYIAAIK